MRPAYGGFPGQSAIGLPYFASHFNFMCVSFVAVGVGGLRSPADVAPLVSVRDAMRCDARFVCRERLSARCRFFAEIKRRFLTRERNRRSTAE